MDDLLQAVAAHFGYVVIGVCVLAGMLLKAVTTMVGNAARERSRREIAAYIAEGSMTPEQGERLIRAEISGRRPV